MVPWSSGHHTINCTTVFLQAFVQHQQQEKRPLLSDNEEANELVSDPVHLHLPFIISSLF